MASRVGLTRRLQALRALGWSNSQLARLTGLNPATVRRVANDEHTPLTEPTGAAIVAGYRRAECHLPPATDNAAARQVRQIRDDAARRGWAPPFAWDDIDTDVAPQGVRAAHHDDVAVDEVVLLLQLGLSPLEVAARVKVKPESLARRLRRAGERGWARDFERETTSPRRDRR